MTCLGLAWWLDLTWVGGFGLALACSSLAWPAALQGQLGGLALSGLVAWLGLVWLALAWLDLAWWLIGLA